jgi:hypothetical protein
MPTNALPGETYPRRQQNPEQAVTVLSVSVWPDSTIARS